MSAWTVEGDEKDVSAVSGVLDMKANLKVVEAVAGPRKKDHSSCKKFKIPTPL
jgi:hypothetical protein